MIKLRDYQRDAIEGLRNGFRGGHKKQLLSAATGAGKTELAISLFSSAIARGSRCLFLVDRVVLLRQASERFHVNGLPHGIIGGGMTRATERQIIIATQQSLELRGSFPPADMIVVDEAHTQRKITTEYIRSVDAAVIGLSATGFSAGMGETYSNVVNAAVTYDLIDQGFLVFPDVYTATPIDMSGAKTAGGEWTDAEVGKRTSPIVGDIVSEWKLHTQKVFGGPVKTLVFSPTIACGAELAAEFNAAGYRFEQVSAKRGPKPDDFYATDLDEVEKIRKFKDGEIDGLISVDKLAKGFDVPDVLCGISARPYRKSLAGHIQQLGRVMRASPGKDKALWLDHAGNFTRHWDATDDFFRNGLVSLETGKLAKYQSVPAVDANKELTCYGCGFVLKPAMTICPMCGKARPEKKSKVSVVAGRMEKFKLLKNEIGDLWPHISRYAIERHPTDMARALKFAKAQHKTLTGRWPENNLQPADQCDPRVAHQIELSFRRWLYAQKKKRPRSRAG